MSYFLGYDVGGTKIKCGVVDDEGEIESEITIDTPKKLQEFLDSIGNVFKDFKEKYDVEAAGLGIAGFHDLQKGIIYNSPNIDYLREVKIKLFLNRYLTVPFFINNDANLAAWGEYKKGSGKNSHSMVFITLGTGVGSGIILNGKLWVGANGFGGEFGHSVVNPEGDDCKCGGKGCVETEVAAAKIVKNYLAMKKKEEILDTEEIYLRAEKGDKDAIEAFRKAGYYLGIGLSSLINILNPQRIVIGGGIIGAGDFIMKPAVEEIKRRCHEWIYKNTEISIASLGNRAGMIGAALWAKENL